MTSLNVILPKSRPPVLHPKRKFIILSGHTTTLNLAPSLAKCTEEEEASTGAEVCIYVLLTAFA